MKRVPSDSNAFTLGLYALGGVLLLFVIAPIIGLILQTPATDLAETAANEEVRRSIALTLWTAMAATAVLSVLAIPMGYLLARYQFPLKGFVTAIVEIPIVIPHSAAGIALLTIVAGDGWIARGAESAGLEFVGRTLGIALAMGYVSVPFLISASRDGFAAVPVRLEQAAMNLGASPAQAFFTVSLPMARRSILSGAVLMWGRGMSEFGAVMVVTYSPMVTPVLIWEYFNRYGLAYTRPLALIFIAVCLAAFVVVRVLTGPPDAQRS